MTRQRLSRLPRAAVILLLGFLLTRVAGFMSYPLIALYATNHGGFGLSELGFLMGLPPAVSLTLSIPCGLLADRLGGRAMIILSILAATLAYGVLASAQEPGLMYLAVILIGVYRASFNAPGMVILGSSGAGDDVTRLFSLQFIAINLGATVGPILGALVSQQSMRAAFGVSALLFASYLVVFCITMPRVSPAVPTGSHSAAQEPRLAFRHQAVRVWQDRSLLLYLLFATSIAILDTQTDSMLPVVLQHVLDQATSQRLYTVLLVTNAVLVIALQPLVLRVLSPTTLRASLALAGACYSVSSLLYAMGSVSIWPFIVSMIFLSIGEATIGVGESLYIDLIASKEQRSFYFSCLSLINGGSMIGPPLCGWLIAHSSYTDAFLSFAVGPLVGALLFARARPKPAGAPARETCPSGTQSSSQVHSTSALVDP